ncbi:MAG: acetylglutamate kinase, partial [Oscillospiraceae bacterium]
MTNSDRAHVLVQALPYIKKYAGETIVVKYGGNAMINEKLKEAVISDIVLMQLVGINVVLVHGGGPEINSMLQKIGKESKFVGGMRYTDGETMGIVQQILAGKVNKDLVQLIEDHGGKAIGLCGLDGSLLKAKKLETGADLGFVGEICEVNTAILKTTAQGGYIPVVSTVAAGYQGEVYNINADVAAAEIAAALSAKKLILMTDIRGLLR